MHELANKLIRNNINETIDNWDYETRKRDNPGGCVHYVDNTKCHNMEDLNCFFCLCPEYDRTVKEGACKINSQKGKYIPTPNGSIFDCSDCILPHKRENIIKLLDNLYTDNDIIIS